MGCDIPCVEVGVVILTTLVAAMVQTVAGFGFSLLAVPTLAIFMEPAQAVPLSAMLSFLNANRVAQQTRGETPWRLVMLLLVGSLVGARGMVCRVRGLPLAGGPFSPTPRTDNPLIG